MGDHTDNRGGQAGVVVTARVRGKVTIREKRWLVFFRVLKNRMKVHGNLKPKNQRAGIISLREFIKSLFSHG